METNAVTQSSAASNVSSSRLDYVDIAKGIVIFCVVLSHTWFANTDILGDLLPYSMPVFFFLSGFTYRSGRSYWVNIRRRAIALLVPYILFNTVWNLLYPLYVYLSNMPAMQLSPWSALWFASFRTDSYNMLMCTPMWFLVALFTASVIFFAVIEWARKSLKNTIITVAVLVGVALVFDIIKHGVMNSTEVWWWYWDLAPYAAALMVLGTWFGQKKLYAKLTRLNVVIGLACLAGSLLLNVVFWGSARTSIVKYIEGYMWYGVLTGFVIAVLGTIGTICVARLAQTVKPLRVVFSWMGRISIWILCIHYTFIFLGEMWLYNHRIISVSIFDVVTQQLYSSEWFPIILHETPSDIIVKICLALVSILVAGLYALIHNKVKAAVKAKLAARKASQAETTAAD